MNEQASILFNIPFSLSGKRVGEIELSPQHSYLQHSIYAALARSLYTQEGFKLLGRQLTTIAHRAYYTRQTGVMQEASQLMLALPLSEELKSIAHYYQAIYAWKQGNADAARRILSQVIETASPFYQARGLLSTGATYFGQSEFEAALPHYLAAIRIASEHDVQTFVTAQRMIAVVRSIYGDHQQAIGDLERLLPLVRAIAKHYPTCYYDFLNSYAIELGEVGRIAEAQNVCAVTLASPFAASYPEYTQTRDELAAKRTAATPSVIAVPAVSEIISSSQAQVEPEPEPARARSTISLKFRRSYSLTRVLTKGITASLGVVVSTRLVLDQIAYSILPRSPPALS